MSFLARRIAPGTPAARLAACLFACALSSSGQHARPGVPLNWCAPGADAHLAAYSPDGQHPVLREDDGTLAMFWPGPDSYLARGRTLFELGEAKPVLRRGADDDFDNGGAWLYSVLRRQNGGLLGFYHAEDHRFPDTPDSGWIAYKSIARCVSGDGGETWGERAQIVTAHEPKPRRARWSGLGDHSVVRDEERKRFVCFFQENGLLCVAESTDEEGRPGTWRKWFKGRFQEPGLGGRATPIPGLSRRPGGNPSLLWSASLKRWTMAWHGWDGNLWFSTSEDLTTWAAPRLLLARPPGGKVWYPTLIEDATSGDGAGLWLLHAEFADEETNTRRAVLRRLEFTASAEGPSVPRRPTFLR